MSVCVRSRTIFCLPVRPRPRSTLTDLLAKPSRLRHPQPLTPRPTPSSSFLPLFFHRLIQTCPRKPTNQVGAPASPSNIVTMLNMTEGASGKPGQVPEIERSWNWRTVPYKDSAWSSYVCARVCACVRARASVYVCLVQDKGSLRSIKARETAVAWRANTRRHQMPSGTRQLSKHTRESGGRRGRRERARQTERRASTYWLQMS